MRGFQVVVQHHEHHMQQALQLAARGQGCTSPNPLVGCVIVRDDKVIGEGWHAVYGHAHAEVNALNDARNKGHDPRGATLYVTLEPCHHHGLTPPCTQAIAQAGIAVVVYAMADPNPKAAGGAHWLESQGVTLISGTLESEAREQNRFFLKHVRTALPYVIAKSATSLDGRVSTRTGHSQWITGPDARERGHDLRQQVDAILVGADTVIADDPSLTVRLPESVCAKERVRHPRPVVLDSTGRVPPTAKLLNGSLTTQTLVITTDQMNAEHCRLLESRGVEVIRVNKHSGTNFTDPVAILEALGQKGIQSLLIEGGPSVHGSFRDAGLIDEIWNFIAPTLIGGEQARAAFAGVGSDTLGEATALGDLQVETVGNDLLVRARVIHQDQTDDDCSPVINSTIE